MIELENLNNQPLEEILEDAKRQILYLSSDWTNFQESDPGITLMELLVWLKWVQHEYLNRVSPGVKDKFLRLLDIDRYKNKGARALIEVSGLSDSVNVPRGTPWRAGNMVFRNPGRQYLVNSQILSVEFNSPNFNSEEEYYKFDGKRIFHIFGDKFRKADSGRIREFIIKLNSPLPSDKNVNLYFDMYLGENLKRNPIKDEKSFEDMAYVKWQYYGSENGAVGWHDVKIKYDETHKFLFSGIIRFKIPGQMQSYNGVYAIRIRLSKQEYDFPPAITGIKLNVFDVVQGEAKCENLILKKKDIIKGNSVVIESHMAIYGEHLLYIREKKSGGWIKTDGFTFERDIDNGRLNLTVNGLNDTLKDYRNEDEVVMLVSYKKEIAKKMILGDGTGTSYQNIEFRENNVLYDGFQIMISEKIKDKEVFYVWRRVSDFFSSDKYDRDYVLDERRERIIFGDHFLGMAPRKGKDNIRLCRLETCFGERSNIKKGMINSVDTENQILKRARVLQLTDAQGGMDFETMKHAQARSADLFSECGRTVTMQDYKRIVGETPGLILKTVRILPNYIHGKTVTDQNCVTIAVRWNNKINVDLPESYKRNIIRQIDKYRLVNTKIDVVGPVYIGLIVSGDIVVNSFYKKSDHLVEKQIENFVNNLNKEFGQTLHYGDLFGMLDKLDYVSYLERLKIIPKGDFNNKNVSEDVFIPPNGIYYIDKIDMNYIRNSNI